MFRLQKWDRKSHQIWDRILSILDRFLDGFGGQVGTTNRLTIVSKNDTQISTKKRHAEMCETARRVGGGGGSIEL